MPKAELAKVLHQIGTAADVIDDILEPLPDPIDLDRYGDYLLGRGITRERLVDRMGGSP
jgi:hypothetical protein